MRDIHDERFINELMSNLDYRSNYLSDMSDTVRKVLTEGSDRTDTFDVSELDELVFITDGMQLDWLSNEVFHEYTESVGDVRYDYLVNRLTFFDNAVAIRVRVYEKGLIVADEFSNMSYFTSFNVDQLADYLHRFM